MHHAAIAENEQFSKMRSGGMSRVHAASVKHEQHGLAIRSDSKATVIGTRPAHAPGVKN